MAKEKTQDPRLLCYISSIPYGFDFPYRGNEGKQHQDRGQGPKLVHIYDFEDSLFFSFLITVV